MSSSAVRLTERTAASLRCPKCSSAVQISASAVACSNCGSSYLVTETGIPMLIDEAQSVFRVAEILESELFFSRGSRLVELSKRLLPSLGRNYVGKRNIAHLRALLLAASGSPRVLVLGGGSFLGDGMEALLDPRIEMVETDVVIGPRTQIVCDAHSIPFASGSFDAVVAQAVLEHVADPFQVVSEMHRVLRAGGYAYAETPFMQQVHGGAYDFLRFTHLGHRRLFREFAEISSGAVAGPGAALAWAWEYFLASFVTNYRLRPAVRAFARITAAPLKYLDALTLERPGGLDAASGTYFLGSRSDVTISDRELVESYRGCNPVPRRRERSDRALSGRR